MNLLEDVKRGFERASTEVNPDSSGTGIVPTAITEESDTLAPGFFAMREYNDGRVKVMLRRGYRHFAGAPLPDDSIETLEVTKEELGTLITSVVIEAFCDGVQVGQASSHQVKMALFYENLNDLFTNEHFRNDTLVMALEFAEDTEVRGFFADYVMGAVRALARATGFAPNTGISHKIWDLWLLCGTSLVTSGYIAGYQLGGIWKERDVLSGLETEMEEGNDSSS